MDHWKAKMLTVIGDAIELPSSSCELRPLCLLSLLKLQTFLRRCPKIPAPSQEDVDLWHARYVKELSATFQKWTLDCLAPGGLCVLAFVMTSGQALMLHVRKAEAGRPDAELEIF